MSDWVEPDWKQVSHDLRRFIMHRLSTKCRRPVDEEILSDFVSESVISLYKWCCRERELGRTIGSIEAMMNRRASFAAVDIIREMIKRELLDPIEDLVEKLVPPPPPPTYAAERNLHAMMEFFRRQQANCVELAPHVAAGKSHDELAQQVGLRVETVRQRWSRCCRAFKEYLREVPEVEAWIWAEEA